MLGLIQAAAYAQTFEELKSTLEDAKKFAEAANGSGQSSQKNIDHCFNMNDLDEVAHCLYKVENDINAILENIDNAYFNIDKSIEINDFMSCSGVSKELKGTVEYLNETESDLNLAIDYIQSAEGENTMSGFQDVLVITKEKLEASEKDLANGLNSLNIVLNNLDDCKH